MKYILNQKQKKFILEKVLSEIINDEDLTFYKVKDLHLAMEKGYEENNKFILELSDEMSSDFQDACTNCFLSIGRKKDDEPNEDGYFAEELVDLFYNTREGEK